MALCRSCQREIDNDARFCPHCGRDQTVLFPPQDTIKTDEANTNVPPPNTHREPGAGQTVVRGMGYSLGGCIMIVVLIVATSVIFFVGCAAILAAGSSG